MNAFRKHLIAIVIALPALAFFAQTVPTTINYQGRLTDNSPSPIPISATVNMTFEIWDAPSAGTRQWIEPNSGATPIVVTGGIFNVLLGASAGASSVPIPVSLFSGGTARYLQIIVNGETLTPRQTISATGYANQAQNAALAANATTAANSLLLGGVASGSWQRSLSTTSCPAGQFYNAIAQAGTASCTSAQTSITPPLTLSGSLGTPVISGTNAGTVPDNSSGVYGENSTTASRVYGVHGRISSTSPGNISAGVRGENLGTTLNGIGVWGSQAGSGYGVFGIVATSGVGVYGAATGGFGVVGNDSGSGYGGLFSCRGSPCTGLSTTSGTITGTALEIGTGGIKVTGAGLNTGTAVFIHQATAANISGSATAITNAMTDGNPGAILIVTKNYQVSNIYDPHTISVYYFSGKWGIVNEDGAAMPVNTAFNVLVIKP